MIGDVWFVLMGRNGDGLFLWLRPFRALDYVFYSLFCFFRERLMV